MCSFNVIARASSTLSWLLLLLLPLSSRKVAYVCYPAISHENWFLGLFKNGSSSSGGALPNTALASYVCFALNLAINILIGLVDGFFFCFVFLLINQDRQNNYHCRSGLTETFRWRRLLWPSPKIENYRLQKICVVVATTYGGDKNERNDKIWHLNESIIINVKLTRTTQQEPQVEAPTCKHLIITVFWT